MKHERNLYSQTRRIDREKANTAKVVLTIPEDGIEGDLIHLGEPPERTQDDEGYYIRLQGEWRFIGGVTAPTDDVDDDDTPPPPSPNRGYSTRLL